MQLTDDPTEKEDPSPADGLLDAIPDGKRETVPDVDTPIVESYRGAPELWGVVVGQNGHGKWTATSSTVCVCVCAYNRRIKMNFVPRSNVTGYSYSVH